MVDDPKVFILWTSMKAEIYPSSSEVWQTTYKVSKHVNFLSDKIIYDAKKHFSVIK